MTDPEFRSSDEKFLDELYAQTKNETSPESLDTNILVQAKNHTEKQYSSVFKWQRLASVAAVMVFSVYIFFDVQEERDRYSESDMYAPQPGLQTAPKVDFYSGAEEAQGQHFEGERISKESIIEKTLAEESAIQESLSDMEVATMSELPASSVVKEAAKSEAKLKSIQALKKEDHSKKKATEMRAKKKAIEQGYMALDKQSENTMPRSVYRKTPQQLVMDIRLMISKFRPEKARELYEILIHEYEDYEVPQDIELYMQALDKRN